MHAVAAAGLLVQLRHGVAELFKPRAFVRQLEAALDAVFLPELAAGLRPKGQVQFNVAENLVAECQHPQRDLSFVTGGKCLQRIGIVLACAPELDPREPVGHQVGPPQVIGPEQQIVLKCFAVAWGEIGGGNLVRQRLNRVAKRPRQGVVRPGPVHHQTRRQHMRLHELMQRARRDVPQKMPGIENLHCNNPTCCSCLTGLSASGQRNWSPACSNTAGDCRTASRGESSQVAHSRSKKQ
ncbi:hypothetical protein GO281_04864 [Ralstonia solanacearum]|nr:hypothetical protein [Ralstonia solanacearum]NKA91415.1 hypothetical protein [Ralstonia solanacearum]NKF77685.1 hypothetical protein [Ralstonia solanacearum]